MGGRECKGERDIYKGEGEFGRGRVNVKGRGRII